MSETTTETTAPALIPHAIYSHYGAVMMAVDAEYLVPIARDGGTKSMRNAQTELIGIPGSHPWNDRMLRVREALIRDYTNEAAELQRLRAYVTELGEAILEKANEKQWCEEYDEFAEEWDLPKRLSEYDVTLTVRVRAADGEGAIDLVKGEVSMDSYHDDVVTGPEFHVEVSY
jgi:hypothetical protein